MAFVNRDAIIQAFKTHPGTEMYLLNDVTLTGNKLGKGSFGSVQEVKYMHCTCAGKKFHNILTGEGQQEVNTAVLKYLQECHLMASLRHPNITQFLGICFLPGTPLPLLVMERLANNLDNFLEKTPSISLARKCSILADVSRGLYYLHTRNPAIIHRDLTAKNVLLTSSLTAKITDMGNSRLDNQFDKNYSSYPGTLLYMPPEALNTGGRYGPSLDIFSFGHLALFTITQVYPKDLSAPTYTTADDSIRGRSEVDRRDRYIRAMESEIGDLQPHLVQIVKNCLHNKENKRPTTEQLLLQLQDVNEACGTAERRTHEHELAEKDRRIQELHETIRHLQEERQEALRSKDHQIQYLRERVLALQSQHKTVRHFQNEKQGTSGASKESVATSSCDTRPPIQRLKPRNRPGANKPQNPSAIQPRSASRPIKPQNASGPPFKPHRPIHRTRSQSTSAGHRRADTTTQNSTSITQTRTRANTITSSQAAPKEKKYFSADEENSQESNLAPWQRELLARKRAKAGEEKVPSAQQQNPAQKMPHPEPPFQPQATNNLEEKRSATLPRSCNITNEMAPWQKEVLVKGIAQKRMAPPS